MMKNKIIIFAMIILVAILVVPTARASWDCAAIPYPCPSLSDPLKWCTAGWTCSECETSCGATDWGSQWDDWTGGTINCNSWEKGSYDGSCLDLLDGCTCSLCTGDKKCTCDTTCMSVDGTASCDVLNDYDSTTQCITKTFDSDTVGGYMNRQSNGAKCVYNDYLNSSTDCCSSGICTENYCCNHADCSAAGSGVVMDPSGSGNCDAHTAEQLGHGIYCGTPTCAGGYTSDRTDKVSVPAGACGCVDDIAEKYYDSGVLETNQSINFLSSRNATEPVTWYDITLSGLDMTGPAPTAYAEFAYCTKSTCSASDWSLYNNYTSADFPHTTIYPDDIQTSKHFQLKLNLHSNIPGNGVTPSIDRAFVRSLPRLYNSTGNIQQLPAQSLCWPVTEDMPRAKINCDLDDESPVISKVACSTTLRTNGTRVLAMLDSQEYAETNETDNAKVIKDDNWCYELDESARFMLIEDEGSLCMDSSECYTFCCMRKDISETQGTCQVGLPIEIVNPQPGYFNTTLIYTNTSEDGDPEYYCGMDPTTWAASGCDSDFDCATSCCDTDSAMCVLPLTDYSNCDNT